MLPTSRGSAASPESQSSEATTKAKRLPTTFDSAISARGCRIDSCKKSLCLLLPLRFVIQVMGSKMWLVRTQCIPIILATGSQWSFGYSNTFCHAFENLPCTDYEAYQHLAARLNISRGVAHTLSMDTASSALSTAMPPSRTLVRYIAATICKQLLLCAYFVDIRCYFR